jgi:hypothetical protein
MEMFRPGVFAPGELVLYLDLDSLVVGSLDRLASYHGPLALLSDFYGLRKGKDRGQSGVMLFRPGKTTGALWERFVKDPAAEMRRHRGDGEWLHSYAPAADRIQRLFPGAVVSLKVHAKDGAPEGSCVVAGHGEPRFTDPRAGWAHRHWAGLAA